MGIFKFRAECLQDIFAFIQGCQWHVSEVKIETIDCGPDVEMEFDTDLSIDELLPIIQQIEDGHVMADTLTTSKEYTGERTYKN